MTSVLAGQTFLIVEDNLWIAVDLASSFEETGAQVITAFSRDQALGLIEAREWAGAVLDYALGDGDCTSVCEWFLERKIPVIIHSGYENLCDPCSRGVQLPKPADSEEVVKTMGLLVARSKSLDS
jgi:DNA-binding response OmpR family regulator